MWDLSLTLGIAQPQDRTVGHSICFTSSRSALKLLAPHPDDCDQSDLTTK